MTAGWNVEQGVDMGAEHAFEVRHEGRIYRAAGMEVLLQWAREHRITLEDHFRVAGTDPWLPVSDETELRGLLDPENWWTLKMASGTFIAPDWDTVVLWTREGRLTEDVQITGPKTPPGGILGKASPELAPYLKEPVPDEPEIIPPRLRFDGRTFLPGDIETVCKWIGESRVPREAEISIDNGPWLPLAGSDEFPEDLWPREAIDPTDQPELKDEVSADAEDGADGTTEDPVESDAGEPQFEGELPEPFPGLDVTEPYRITTTFGEDFTFTQPRELQRLVSRKKVHSFDEVRHPGLPEGSMFIGEFMESMNIGRQGRALHWILAGVFAAGAAALFVLGHWTGWMLIAGAAAAAAALTFMILALRTGR